MDPAPLVCRGEPLFRSKRTEKNFHIEQLKVFKKTKLILSWAIIYFTLMSYHYNFTVVIVWLSSRTFFFEDRNAETEADKIQANALDNRQILYPSEKNIYPELIFVRLYLQGR